MNRTKQITNIIGWYGVIAILSAYFLVSFDVISAQTLLYQALNITGALGIVYDSFKKKDVQPGILNIIWAIIALIAIVKLIIQI
jgi:hypothetical protein